MAHAWQVGLGASAIALAVLGGVVLVRGRDRRAPNAHPVVPFLSDEGPGTHAHAIEPNVAVSDRGGVLVTWMRVEKEGAADAIGVRFSHDDGDKFGPIQLVRSPDGRFAADPAIAVLPDGSFVLTWLGFRADLAKHGDPYDMRVYAARAQVGADRFDAPVLVTTDEADHEYDRPWSTVTKSGTIVLAYRSAYRGKAGITLATSKDGKAWDRKELFSAFNYGGGLPTTCAEQERVYVSYLDPQKGILLRSSDDDYKREVVVSAPGENVALEPPSCVAASDEVLVAYGIGAGPADTATSAVLSHVALARSLDAGHTFDARAEASEPGRQLVHPRAVPAPDGLAFATYVLPGELRLLRVGFGTKAHSALLRGGLTVAPRRSDPAWPGDYLGIFARKAGDSARAYVAYVDASAGSPQIAFMVTAL